MARCVLIALVLALSSGCVRVPFDLCDEADAHPECPHDAGNDIVTDGGMDSGG